MERNSRNARSPSRIPENSRACLVLGIVLLSTTFVAAESLETQSNPVARGTIQVVNGNASRTDWQAIPSYDEDGEDGATPNNYLSVQVANDAEFLYFRFLMDESEEYGFRHNLYLDADQDRETGFIGTGADGFLSVGADYLVQGGSVFRFSAAAPNEWGWTHLEDIAWDATPSTDIEVAVRRVTLNQPPAFDFFMNAANFDLGTPEDFYPDNASIPDGDYLSYLIGSVAVVGIDELTAAVRAGSTDGRFDLNQDGLVNSLDRIHWVEVLNKTYFGDANLDGLFNTGDFIVVFQAGEYEDTTVGNSRWASGDWDGDGDFTSGDFVAAFQGAGFEQGPRAAMASVPEPTHWIALAWLLPVLRRKRRG
jgi:hypothetical protein